MVSPLVALLWCSLLCLALGAAGSAPEGKKRRFDPEFKSWLNSGSLPSLELMVESLQRSTERFNRRLVAFENNVNIILKYYRKGDSRTVEGWLASIHEHNHYLSNRYANLRHRTFILYTLYMNGGRATLEELGFSIEPVIQAERAYMDIFEGLSTVLGNELTASSNEFIEKIPTWHGPTISTWLNKLDGSPVDEFDLASKLGSGPWEALERISELLYWREVAAARKHHAAHHGITEKCATQAQRDADIERRIRAVEMVIAGRLKGVEWDVIIPLLEMADGYVRAFVERTSALGYGPEAQEKVANNRLLHPEHVAQHVLKDFFERFSASTWNKMQSFSQIRRKLLGRYTIKLLTTVYMNGPLSMFTAADYDPMAAVRNELEKAEELNLVTHALSQCYMANRLLGVPSEPIKLLTYFWDAAGNNPVQAPQEADADFLDWRDANALVKGSPLTLTDYRTNWPMPRTLEKIYKVARKIAIVTEANTRSLSGEDGHYARKLLGQAKMLLRAIGTPWSFKNLENSAPVS